jgi:carbon storage regulator
MLVLSRKNQDSVVVGGTNGYEEMVRVTVLGIRGGTVRLGFEAGDEVPIHRAEIWDRISAERQLPKQLSDAEQPREPAPYTD